jgi:hypothetical protein
MRMGCAVDWRPGAVLIALGMVGKKHGKRYAFPTEKRLTELINEFHGFGVSERTVRREVKYLKDERWFDVVRRVRRVEGGKKVFTSNLYKFRKKFFIWLESLEKVANGLFSHFRRPKKAVNQLHQKHAFQRRASELVDKVLIGSIEGMADPGFG